MKFYKRWIGDYQRDTGHLSIAEHGAYTLMLDIHYATEKPLPGDRIALYRLLRAVTEGEQAAVDVVLDQFWTETVDGWVNGRAADVMAEAAERSKKARESARQRWTENPGNDADALKKDANAPENDADAHADASKTDATTPPNASISDASHSQSQSHSHSQKEATTSGARAREGPIGEMESELARFLESLPDAKTRRKIEAQARMILTGEDRKAWETEAGAAAPEAERPELFRLALGYHRDGTQSSLRSSVRYAVKLYTANERDPPDPEMGKAERKLAERIAKLQSVDLSTAFQS